VEQPYGIDMGLRDPFGDHIRIVQLKASPRLASDCCGRDGNAFSVGRRRPPTYRGIAYNVGGRREARNAGIYGTCVLGGSMRLFGEVGLPPTPRGLRQN
jgi:hypothetical protein